MAWISRPSSSAKGLLLPARSITKTLAVPLPVPRPSARRDRFLSVPLSKSERSPCCQKWVSTAKAVASAPSATKRSRIVFIGCYLLYCDSERETAVDQHVEGNAALLDRAFRRGLQMAAGGAVGLHHIHDGSRQTGQRFVFIEHGGPGLYQRNIELIIAALLIH